MGYTLAWVGCSSQTRPVWGFTYFRMITVRRMSMHGTVVMAGFYEQSFLIFQMLSIS